MKTSFNHFAIYIATIIVLASCSGKPSASRAEKDLSQRISRESKGDLNLIDFEKLNAVDKEFFGQKSYVIQYKGTLKVEEECFMYVNKSGFGSFFQGFKTYDKEPAFIPSLQKQIVTCSKGEDVDFRGEIVYAKTEEGWVEYLKPSLR